MLQGWNVARLEFVSFRCLLTIVQSPNKHSAIGMLTFAFLLISDLQSLLQTICFSFCLFLEKPFKQKIALRGFQVLI